MGPFRDWIAESNARKRAVQAALNGTGPALPGSYAACPSTNARAMKDAEEDGCVGDCSKKGKKKKKKDDEEDISEAEKKPDYSFDRFVKQAEEMKRDVTSFVAFARQKEAEMDKKAKETKKTKVEKEPELNKKPDKEENKWDKKDSLKKSKEDSSEPGDSEGE